MSKQPKYLDHDGLRDSLIEMYYDNSPFRVEHIAKRILEGEGIGGYMTEDKDSGSVFIQNDYYRIQVRQDCISFNCINGYQRWLNYAPFIQKVIRQVLSLEGITFVRQKIRYISMYPNTSVFDNLRGEKMKLDSFPQIDGTEIRFQMRITDSHYFGIATVRLTDNLPSNKPSIKVSVVDLQIDTNTSNELLNETMEFLHTQERNLFFSLLSDSFFDSLGAHYA